MKINVFNTEKNRYKAFLKCLVSLRTLYATIIFCLFSTPIFSQNQSQNLSKYWQYRDRLVNNFMVVGEGQGKSLPAGGRNPTANCQADWWMGEAGCDKPKGMGKLQWGDGTIHLGYYITVLATELRLLLDAGQETERTKEELYYAFRAFERLDKEAETRFGQAGKLDGFFIRDDVTNDILYDKNGNSNFPKGKNDTYNCVLSDGGCGEANIKSGDFVSQDQVISLLFGMTCVAELIPNERWGKRQTFGDMAAANTHRMVSFMRNNKWHIKDPTGRKAPNRWGGNARPFSYSIAKTANRITQKKYRKSYQSGQSRGLGAVLHGTYDWLFGVQTHYNHPMIFTLMVTSDSWDRNKMGAYCKKSDQEVYALADVVLNDKKLSKRISKESLEAILNTAPRSGPCFQTPGCTAPDGWKSNNRWLHPTHKKGNKYGVYQEWNGLDYMMLYNFYHLYYSSELPNFRATS